MKLTKILEEVMTEIGDASKKPYGPIDTLTDDEAERQYGFSTDSGIIYEVKVETFYRGEGKPVIARVQFGIIDEDGDVSYDAQTGENDIYRIMSTIVEIVKKDLKDNHADIIEFTPSKRAGNKDKESMSNVRTQLYSRYIKGQWPNAEVTKSLRGDIKVILNPLLKEIGDTTNVDTYMYSKIPELETYDEEVYKMEFATESDTNYVVIINKIDRNEDNIWRMDIEFGIENESEGGFPPSYDYTSVVNKGEMYKVMATVVKAVKKEIEDSTKKGQNIVTVRIEPSKNFENDTRRANLYMAYIKKNMPKGSKIEVSPNFKQIDILMP